MHKSTATTKAVLVCLLLASVGVFGWFQTGANSPESFLLLGYYGILIVNTFFSIRTFSVITPPNTLQTLFDIALVGAYCALTFSFGSVLLFSIVSASFFVMAVAKYTHLNRLITYPELLPRKIRINSLGVLLSLGAFGASVLGHQEIAAWALCIVFAVANVYLLAIKPMYWMS